MKIALLGTNFGLMHAALKLHELGAHVKIYAANHEWQNELLRYKQVGSNSTLIVAASQEHQKIYDSCFELGLLRNRQVTRVQKRYLGIGEEILGRSRFFDLFRVCYQENSTDNSAITLDGASQELKARLAEPLERFEDYDVVIDGRQELMKNLPLGCGDAEPINMNYLKNKEKIFSAEDFLAKADNNIFPALIVGDGVEAAKVLVKLEDAILDGAITYLITQNKSPFSSFKKNYIGTELKQRLDQLFFKLQEKKKTGGEENFFFYCGYQVACLDQMIDQQGYFVSLDAPDLLQDNHKHLTLNALSIINCKRKRVEASTSVVGLDLSWLKTLDGPASENGDHPEKGYFSLLPNQELTPDLINEEAILLSEKIRNQLLTLFRKVE